MKIHIKTTLITLTIEDDPNDAASISSRHSVPELIPAVQAAVEEAIKLHNAVDTPLLQK